MSSAVLFAATPFMWARSYHAVDQWRSPASAVYIVSAQGYLEVWSPPWLIPVRWPVDPARIAKPASTARELMGGHTPI